MTAVTLISTRRAECAACLAESDGRYEWEGSPLCKGCHPQPEAPWKALPAAEARRLREAIARKRELVRPAVEEVLGVSYADLGPPRRSWSPEAYDREIARQERLLALGLLRRGRVQGHSVTLGWGRYHDGRFAWHGYDNDGIAMWSGRLTSVGGFWPSGDDYERGWCAGKQAPFTGPQRRRQGQRTQSFLDEILGDYDFDDLLG